MFKFPRGRKKGRGTGARGALRTSQVETGETNDSSWRLEFTAPPAEYAILLLIIEQTFCCRASDNNKKRYMTAPRRRCCRGCGRREGGWRGEFQPKREPTQTAPTLETPNEHHTTPRKTTTQLHSCTRYRLSVRSKTKIQTASDMPVPKAVPPPPRPPPLDQPRKMTPSLHVFPETQMVQYP